MNWLNARDKEAVIYLALFVGVFNRIDKGKKIREEIDKEFYKNLKYARTYALKAMDTYMNCLNEKERQNVINSAKNREIVVCLKGENMNKIKENLKLEKQTLIDNEQLHKLIDLCSASCSVCDVPYEECEYIDMLRGIGVEVVNTNVKTGGCPYRF